MTALATVSVAADAPVPTVAEALKAIEASTPIVSKRSASKDRFVARAKILLTRARAIASHAAERLEVRGSAEDVAESAADLRAVQHLITATLSPNETKSEEEGVTP